MIGRSVDQSTCRSICLSICRLTIKTLIVCWCDQFITRMLGCPLSAQVSRHATILGDIMKRIATEGCYILYAKVLDSAKVGGVPQHRVRLYMVGILKSADDKSFELPDTYDHGGLETISGQEA